MSSIYGFFAGSHSASCSLIVDGKIINCIEEERLTRIKAGDNNESYPVLSANQIENISGIKISESDYKVFVMPNPDKFSVEITNNSQYETVSHHESHCHGAYFTSGMEGKVLTVSYDGGGDLSVMKIYLCENGNMNLSFSMNFASFGSLPLLWAFSTNGIRGYDEYGQGFWKMLKDEGKLMGMAPNGYYDENIYNMLKTCINYNNFKFYPSETRGKTKFLIDSMYELGWFSSTKKIEVFAYNLQKLTEDLMLRFFEDLHKKFPEHNKLCLSGGLFGNVKLNQKINELDWVEEMYVYPPMGDEGLSLGACLYKAKQLGEITKPITLQNVFFGKSYSNDEIYLSSLMFDFERVKYSAKEISHDLNNGLIIGWFQGGFEYGPRSLGGRSILVRPTDKETHTILNNRLRRNEVMPFAPIILSENFDEVFSPPKSKYSAEFMTLCYRTNENWIDKIPAVIQITDKTARPQIVVKDKLPKFWEILNEYYILSGVPLLLNTSFNKHNEPIIDTPHQAFSILNDGIIDKLVIEDYVYYIKKH